MNSREAYIIPTKDGHYIYILRGFQSGGYSKTINKEKVYATHELQQALENQEHICEDGSYIVSELHERIEGFKDMLDRAKKQAREAEI